MTEREALKLALEALLSWGKGFPDNWGDLDTEAVTAIKEALAQPEPWEKFCDSNCVWTDHHPDCKLAEPEQKPVVWMYQNKSTHEVRFQKHMRSFVDHGAWYEVPLYSEPLANQEKTSGSPIKQVFAQRKPLTDEEIVLIVAECAASHQHTDIHFARAIERAHGIKELV